MVHDLIEAYGLLKHMKIVRSIPASYADLKEFHSEFYLEHLKTLTEIDDDYTCTEQDEEFGIGKQAPGFFLTQCFQRTHTSTNLLTFLQKKTISFFIK